MKCKMCASGSTEKARHKNIFFIRQKACSPIHTESGGNAPLHEPESLMVDGCGSSYILVGGHCAPVPAVSKGRNECARPGGTTFFEGIKHE